ncbi:MAG: hypothetical protein UV95_C0001G0159 [Candidatus Falkowbacteria bacterium GW2011_GWF2_43_32]|nr:MAG: hypothetical protein UV95_C0001G0159 [Candidatus Falkowbacteria bacterium GW2011_GWF2_43_32]
MLIFFLSLMILGGLALFIFRLQALDWLRERSGLIEPLTPSAQSIVIPAGEALDLTVLKLPQFLGLTNNVIDFDFDDICNRLGTSAVGSGVAVTPLVTSASGTEAAVAPRRCVQGNNSLFFREK